MRPACALAVAALAATIAPASGQAPAVPIAIGHESTVRSNLLDEVRPLLIHLPPEYDDPDLRFPVVFVLDGEAHFHHVTGVTTFLAQVGRMPPSIVVAIPNTDRTRDLTPPTEVDRRYLTAGGADAFLAFLRDELIPFVDREYRTVPYRTLIGHSFGGLFAIHALHTDPDAFDAYVAISPSLWWNNFAPLTRVQQFFDETPSLRSRLYVTLGGEPRMMLDGYRRLVATLEDHAPDGVIWHNRRMADETHTSVPHRSIYQALEFFYEPWRLPADLTELGIAGLDRHYQRMSREYGYPMRASGRNLVTLGRQYLGSSRAALAVEAFERVVADHPRSPWGYGGLGDALKELGEWDRAIANYQEAVDLASATDHPNLEAYRMQLEQARAAHSRNQR